METWGIVLIAIEVIAAITIITVGVYLALSPRKPKHRTAEDLMLREKEEDN